MLRSRSSTCDSIQSSSSPIANCPNRQFTLPPVYQSSAGTSPKQQITLPSQYLGSASSMDTIGRGGGGGIISNTNCTNTSAGGGGSSPSSTTSQGTSGRGLITRTPNTDYSGLGGRKTSTAGIKSKENKRKRIQVEKRLNLILFCFLFFVANMNSLKKRTAPAPPPSGIGSSNSTSNATFYGTLPHPPRHSQNYDLSGELRGGVGGVMVGGVCYQNHKNQSSSMEATMGGGGNSTNVTAANTYGTLPHLRSIEGSPRIPIAGIIGGGGSNYHNNHHPVGTTTNSSSSSTGSHHGGFFERFEKIINQHDGSNAQSGSGGGGGGGGGHHVMTTFGHKRSPSGESLNRSLHLAGAKLVLPPTGEIPALKHVDKSALIRPKIPPPGPPLGENLGKAHSFHF